MGRNAAHKSLLYCSAQTERDLKKPQIPFPSENRASWQECTQLSWFQYQWGALIWTKLTKDSTSITSLQGRQKGRKSVGSADELYYPKSGHMRDQQHLSLKVNSYINVWGEVVHYMQDTQGNLLFLNRKVEVLCPWLCLVCNAIKNSHNHLIVPVTSTCLFLPGVEPNHTINLEFFSLLRFVSSIFFYCTFIVPFSLYSPNESMI